MLKTAGTMVAWPIILPYLEREANSRRMARLMVQPEPPIWTNHWKKGSETTCGSAAPAA